MQKLVNRGLLIEPRVTGEPLAFRDARLRATATARLQIAAPRFEPAAGPKGPQTSGSPPEQTARPKWGWEAGHPPKRVESGANCEDHRREANSQEPLVSRDSASRGR